MTTWFPTILDSATSILKTKKKKKKKKKNKIKKKKKKKKKLVNYLGKA
jgi:hypothetical protein